MITVLFTQKNSIYQKFNTDNWDIEKDATKWPGGNTIIAHPPCRAWGNYRNKAKPRPKEKELAIWAINQIRINNGILEHPSRSKLWETMNLPIPGQRQDHYGGYSISIDQHWFGHRAKKNTWLYIKGIPINKLPLIPISLNAILTTVEKMGKKEREATPIKFAEWLIKTATLIELNKPP
ncbi:MAG: hypothetical protein [Microviridae sp.]|nr:MAG: hypothetical protein [Microviridae sp.]